MKIAILLTSFGATGVEATMVRLANGLSSAGVTVDLLIMDARATGFRHLLSSAVRVVDLHAPRLWTCLPSVVRYLLGARPDAIIAAAPLANGLAGLASRLVGGRVPAVLTEHGLRLFGFARNGTLRHRLLRAVLKLGYKQASALVGVSRGVASELRRSFPMQADRVHVIYNPVWSSEFVTASMAETGHRWLGERSSIPVVLAVGRLDQQKSFDVLIRAIALLAERRDIRLILLGDGASRSALEALVIELGLGEIVDMPGFVEVPQRYMRAASVLVLSSRMEALPTVIIEALACGTPVVSTDCPTGPGEILEGGKYGTLVPVDDPQALAAGIVDSIESVVDRDALRRRARDFAVEIATCHYIELINSLQKQ